MRVEIHSAANFLVHLLRLNHNGLSETQLEMFKASLTEVLRMRYKEHWFPEKPSRGSGYRCIRINGKMDPVVAQAGKAVGLPPTYLHSLFPSELTMWIDPAEVSYRIGENGSICVLYEETAPTTSEEYALERPLTKCDVPACSTGSGNNGGGSGSSASCKESLMFLDPRGVQHLAAYVSS
ncbi:protein BTG2-like [Schistocerca cancellata]|uniref:protein BTG2-like n=1 Tax=Schistocerca cancellata TaxID=274614 RepID=UPI0021177843|nr:protein BTG2-like [Schistocerca cancellata]